MSGERALLNSVFGRAAAAVLAQPLRAGRAARDEAQVAQTCAQRGRDQHFGHGVPRP